MKTEEPKYLIGNSAIHGKGVIAKADIKKGEVIGVAVFWYSIKQSVFASFDPCGKGENNE